MIFSLIIILPIVWVLLLSVKSLPDAYQNDIWPKNFDWSHYGFSLQKIPTLPQNYTNSIVVTLGTVVVTTVCAVLAGYAIVFLEVPGIKILFFALVASMFFPTRVTAVIAIFETQKDLGLLNVPAGLIFPYVTLSLALSVFVMRGMFQTVPHGDLRRGSHRRRWPGAHAPRHPPAHGQERHRRRHHRQLRHGLG